MYCPQCGNTNDDSAKFCVKCGLDLDQYRQQWQEPGTQSAGPEPGQPAYGQQPYQPTYQQPAYQQAPYQQAPYQQAQYGQPARAYGALPNIPSYMGWAIATLILCFWPTGIVAVVHASRVNNRLALGDIAGAQESSRKAKTWSWITFAIGVGITVLAIILWLVAAAAVFTIY